MGIRDYAKTILGRDLTNAEVQAILAKHQALGLKESDPETGILDAVLLEIMVLQRIPERIKESMQDVEKAAASKLTAAASEIVAQSSEQLVEAFREDFAAMTWKRGVWAALIVLAVLAGSWLGGTLDLWWHNRQLQQIEAEVTQMQAARDVIESGAPFTKCGDKLCVPVSDNALDQGWHIKAGPYAGAKLAILDMRIIRAWDKYLAQQNERRR